MLGSIRRTVKALRSNKSGNAALLVAIGMPVLIGGSGLAVDTAQWYMWKRELQFAVDQAALAGAWARTDTATANTYQQRATQEYNANLQRVTSFASTPTVQLGNYNGSTGNSVTVTATATRELPFSSFLTERATTVRAYAQASFEVGRTYTSCLLAVDPDDAGAVTIGGNAVLTAACGIAALSNSPSSIVINGNPTVDAGWIVSAGGVDSWLETNTDDEIQEYVSGLYDPYASLTPPNNPTPRTYACQNATTTTTATRTVTSVVVDKRYSGTRSNRVDTLVSTTPISTSEPVVTNNVTVANGTAAGTATGTSTVTGAVTSTTTGSGRNAVTTYWRTDRVTTTTTVTSNIVVTSTPQQANLLPGTYSEIFVSCATVFSPGVYVINGGRLKITGQYTVTGAGVMFVLKNGAYIDIQGGANVNLTAMSTSQLESAGVSTEAAANLAGMLVFEDPQSAGSNRNTLNGNAFTILNGTVYLPKSGITFAGTAGVTSQCLMVAARTITIQGTTNMSTFCPPGVTEDTEVASSVGSVKLVA